MVFDSSLRDTVSCTDYILEMPYFRDQGFGGAERRHQMEVKAFRIACGEFIGVSDVRSEELEKPGMALVPHGYSYADGIFAARSRGDSMEPRINDGAWCLFYPYVGGSRQDRIVLVEDQSKIGGDRYTLKKFHSRKVYLPDGTWVHEEILLLPLNPGRPPIRLDDHGVYRLCGWFAGTVSHIERIEPPRYRSISEE